MSKRGENIYKRKDGRWEARRRLTNGKYVSIYGKTYSEAKRKLNERIEGMNDNKKTENCNQKIIEELDRWLFETSKRVKLSTYENYYYCMKTYVFPFFEESKACVLTKDSLECFANSIRDNHTLSEAYRNKILTIFKIALRSIIQESRYKHELLNTLIITRKQKKAIMVFSIEEQRAIEKELIKDGNIKAVGILLCFYSGIRLGELAAIKWEDIDIVSKCITIKKTLSRKKNFEEGVKKTILHISSPKNSSSNRYIPLPQFLFDMLAKYNKEDGDAYMLTNKSVPIDPRTLQRYYENILKRANIKYRKFHTIRHTFATRALEIGIDVKTVSELLGHSSVSTTLNIYAHSLMEQKKKAIEKLGAMHGF